MAVQACGGHSSAGHPSAQLHPQQLVQMCCALARRRSAPPCNSQPGRAPCLQLEGLEGDVAHAEGGGVQLQPLLQAVPVPRRHVVCRRPREREGVSESVGWASAASA